jgi:hypothetical protein
MNGMFAYTQSIVAFITEIGKGRKGTPFAQEYKLINKSSKFKFLSSKTKNTLKSWNLTNRRKN